MVKSKAVAIAIAALAGLALLNACANDGPVGPTESIQLDGSGALMGTLPAVRFATTVVPPPPAPEPEPEVEEEEEPGTPNGERNGFYFAKGVLLSSEGSCPGCLLKIRDVSVRVPETGELELERRDATGTVVPMTMDEFAALLAPGLPLDTKSLVGDPEHTAVRVRVERLVRTAGTVDRSSQQVLADGVFMINTKGTVLQFRLSDPDLEIPAFGSGDRVLVTGVVPSDFGTDNPELVALEVRLDN